MTRTLWMRAVLVVVIGGGIVAVLLNRQHFTPEALQGFVGALGLWAPLVYMGIYLIGTVISLPGSVLTLAGGALFGPVWGSLYVLIGSVSGATMAFLIARYVAGDWVEKKASGILRQVKEGAEAEGWHFVAFVRLVPAFPFNLVNYVFGLTNIPLRTYMVASAIFMLPGIAGYVYLGHVGGEALVGGEDLFRKILYGVGVFAALVFLPMLVRRLRAMKNKPAENSGHNHSAPEGDVPTHDAPS